MSNINRDINNLEHFLDLFVDEYGNYYEIASTTVRNGNLTEITLSHVYYEFSSYRMFNDAELSKKNNHNHLSIFFSDLLTSRLENIKKKNRTIFTINDLIANGTKVYFMKLTEVHPRIIKNPAVNS
ncbi:MAG: hypothetical protein ACQEWV_26040 [Bacillota bacterium]